MPASLAGLGSDGLAGGRSEVRLRSRHFAEGMPMPTDRRFDLPGRPGVAGISVLVREGFVVGHHDRLKVPAWVAYEWTRDDHRQTETVSFGRPSWSPDAELPPYARAGVDYEHASTGLQRGHLHRDADAEAWGLDNVRAASLMSNVVPQSGTLNGGAWLAIEDAHRAAVADPARGIERLWVIAGPVFDAAEPDTIGNGVGVPDACFKIVAWNDRGGTLRAMAFLVPQAPPTRRPEAFLVSIDEVERRTGLDFLADLDDAAEAKLERAVTRGLW